MKKSLMFAAAAFFMASLSAGAALMVAPITAVFGHNERDNFDGKINDMIIGSGMNGYGINGNPGWPAGEGLPSTWTATSNAYQAEWQSQDLLDAGESPTNGKIGWTILDISTSTLLEELYIWHIRENSGRVAATYNVYIAATPTAAPVHGPTNNTSINYDFLSGGWTLINTGGALTGSFRGSTFVDLGGKIGRYVGLEILSNGGDGSRVGFAEVAIVIPEPGTLGLLAAIGLAMVLIRRRR